jgi:hypothetical protein
LDCTAHTHNPQSSGIISPDEDWLLLLLLLLLLLPGPL